MKKSKILVLTIGVFGIINTEMGVIGILPLIAQQYGVTITAAGLLVSLFALAVAAAGPIMPLLFSRIERKKAMVMTLSIFLVCNLVSVFTSSFPVLIAVRVLPAFFHPVYISMAFSAACTSVPQTEAPSAASKVMVGVSAGMVLGVPAVTFLAGTFSLRSAMLFFALINAVALMLTFFFLPSFPKEKKLSYVEQIKALGKSHTWISMGAVVLLNGAVFGVYSYLSEYLNRVTGISAGGISVVLLIYGLANIAGNLIAGKMLSTKASAFVLSFPLALGLVYLALLFLGPVPAPAVVLILIWGVLAGAGGNINQYWITTAVPGAPEFANGLFLASTNLGTTIGTAVCGSLITAAGAQSVPLGGVLFLAFGAAALFVRTFDLFNRRKKLRLNNPRP